MPAAFERAFRDLAGDALREHVDEHDVIVGAAADDAEAGGRERAGQPRRVLHDLSLIRGELRRRRFLEADRLGRDDVHQRSALHAGEHRAIEILRVALAAQHHAAARAAQRLVRRRRDEVGVRHRARVHAAGDQAGDVRHVHHQRRADALGDRAHPREIDHARIGAGAGDDHLRLVLIGELLELLVIDPLIVLAHAVRDDRVELSRKIQRMAVREVAAVREVHAEHGVARLQQRQIHAHVGLRARVRLHVDVIGAEQRLGARDRQRFGDVHELAAAVIALARVALGVLVRHHRAGGFEHGGADEVFRRDQLQSVGLPAASRWRWPRRFPDRTARVCVTSGMRSCGIHILTHRRS